MFFGEITGFATPLLDGVVVVNKHEDVGKLVPKFFVGMKAD